MIIPAIYENNLNDVCNKAKILEQAELIHIDFSDGVFVPKKTSFDLSDLQISKPYQVHLMVKNPYMYIPVVKQAVEVIIHVEELTRFEDFSFEVGLGLAIDYETPLEKLEPYLDLVDFVQFMSVKPGKQGNEHIIETTQKIVQFKKAHPHMRLQVDGGINETNIKQYVDLNIEGIVIGSKIINTKEPDNEFQKFINLEKEYQNA